MKKERDARPGESKWDPLHDDGDQSSHELQEIVGYHFRDPSLLRTALTHRSLLNEVFDGDLQDNERLEFLGDAVLGMLTAEWLMEEFPGLREGDLTRLRAALVQESHLAKIARKWDLGRFLLLGKGEEQMGGREKNSLLANAFEAAIAAIYLDGGLAAARETIRSHFKEIVSELKVNWKVFFDPKTRLQEICVNLLGCPPAYKVIRESGPDHEKTFTVELSLSSRQLVVGTGRSKKEAEQEAAASLLDRLKNNPFGLL
jgi:ribonuclease-3